MGSAAVNNCRFQRCAIHGVCARGRSQLTLHACEVVSCGRRGVYSYQNSTLDMADCCVRGTSDTSRAAVEGAGAREGDSVHVSIRRCCLRENAGACIRLRGAVLHSLEENTCEC